MLDESSIIQNEAAKRSKFILKMQPEKMCIRDSPKRGISLAAATVRGLILTVLHKEQIGGLYPQVLETLVYGACRELFK